MIHQDLTTWLDSPAHVDETYIEGRPTLDDLSRFGQTSLKDPCLRVSRWYNCHGISHPMNHYSRTSSHSLETTQGRAILRLSHQLPIGPCVVRPKNPF